MNTELEQLQDKAIVFYDGTCGFCQGSVQFVLKHNEKQDLYFATLQSGLLQQFIPDISTPEPLPDSVFLYEHGSLYSQSDAALRIARHLKFPYSWLHYLRFIPLSLRDFVYGVVAKHRYKIAGRDETCLLPSPEQRARFLAF